MTKDYTVASSFLKKEFDGKFGRSAVYTVTLEGEPEPVELVQKLSTPAPRQGDKLFGRIEPGEYGPKFKKEQTQFGGGPGGGRGRSPEENAIILRQHSQHMAILLLHQLNKPILLDQDEDRRLLKRVVDWFDRDALTAAEKAKQSAVTPESYGKPPEAGSHREPKPASDKQKALMRKLLTTKRHDRAISVEEVDGMSMDEIRPLIDALIKLPDRDPERDSDLDNEVVVPESEDRDEVPF